MAVIINADDVGVSPGCNIAVAECIAKGGVDSVSFFANGTYLYDALKRIPPSLGIDSGVHLTLTYGPALAGKSSLAPDGMLRNSYAWLFLRSLFSSTFRSEVELEFECQIRHLLAKGLRLTHIDSHHHVHMIPALFRITAKLAEKYEISRIRRSCGESFFRSVFAHGWPWWISVAGFAKFALMKIFGLFIPKFDGARFRFVSMLYSGAVTEDMIIKMVERGGNTEIMVHPGVPSMDEDSEFHNDLEEMYWLSDDRECELEACLNAAEFLRKKSVSTVEKSEN